MDIIVRITDKYNTEIIDFFVNESCNLYCKLRGYNNLLNEDREKLKKQLRNLYIMDNDNKTIYIAYVSNKIVGGACVVNNCYLKDLFVKEEYQRKGIGSILIKNIIFDMKNNEEITLSTHPDIVNFYKKNHFIVLEEGKTIKMKTKKYMV